MARRKIEIPTLMGAEATGASAIARLSSYTKILGKQVKYSGVCVMQLICRGETVDQHVA